jgi:DNA-binding beta-propeller fold protein YncE
LISIGIGLWWNRRLWLGNAALFYAIYIVFYTTIFTNGAGFFTGMVGSLGYWLVQQGVERGSQPWYYYLLLQIPIYEYLPALGSLLAFGLAVFGIKGTSAEAEPDSLPGEEPSEASSQRLAVTLLGFWVITSAIAYTYAGEKMPWLTVHIALPMIMLSSWAFGWLIESVDWSAFRTRRGVLIVLLMLVFLASLAGVFGSLLGTNPPFQGKQIEQLQASSTFLFSILMMIASAGGLVYLLRIWPAGQIMRLLALTFFGMLALLTARTAYTASFINYNFANEYLVYAHSGPGANLIMEQVDDISRRLTDGDALVVAYDDKTTYPFWWYLRNYSNARFFGANPTRDLRDAPVIIVGSDNYGKIEPVVGQAFHPFEYVRMWWPNQDYTSLTWENINNQRTRELMADQSAQGTSDPIPTMGYGEYLGRVWNHLSPFFTNPEVRQAVWEVWLNRDFTRWAALSERDLSFPNWQPSEKMRMYLRKDIAAQIWNYGVGPTSEEVIADPYEGKEVVLTADAIFGSEGSEPGQFKRPRDLAVAPDGSLYVADTDNHRIQHLSRDGQVLHTWGSFADASKGEAPGGTFYEPWGIAVDNDGFVYVADTWNHRIQKFTPEGEFIKMWGYFGQAERPDAFWGPRDVVIDSEGRVLVSDTGNKRIVSFDPDGNFVFEFGAQGFEAGEFYEPVGMAVDNQGRLYVADTWNQRIQSFQPNGDGSYRPLLMWDVSAWFGQSLDNKPYLAADELGHVFATDPEGYRVLEFTESGEIVRFWGDYSVGNDGFGLVGSVAIDPQGGVWVSDAGNHRLMHFNLPQE